MLLAPRVKRNGLNKTHQDLLNCFINTVGWLYFSYVIARHGSKCAVRLLYNLERCSTANNRVRGNQCIAHFARGMGMDWLQRGFQHGVTKDPAVQLRARHNNTARTPWT